MADPKAAPVDVVRARRYELVDRQGRLRGIFGEFPSPDHAVPSIYGVCLFDAAGRQRAFLCLDYMGPKLVFDSGGNNALELGVDDDVFDACKVGVYGFATDGRGTPVIAFHVFPDGEVEVTHGERAA